MQTVQQSVQPMSAQQQADQMLAVWQQRRDLPPEKRLAVLQVAQSFQVPA
jgi:hypothetical protein